MSILLLRGNVGRPLAFKNRCNRNGQVTPKKPGTRFTFEPMKLISAAKAQSIFLLRGPPLRRPHALGLDIIDSLCVVGGAHLPGGSGKDFRRPSHDPIPRFELEKATYQRPQVFASIEANDLEAGLASPLRRSFPRPPEFAAVHRASVLSDIRAETLGWALCERDDLLK